MGYRCTLLASALVTTGLAGLSVTSSGHAQTQAFVTANGIGPYHARILLGGEGLVRTLEASSALVAANAPWTIRGWIHPSSISAKTAVLGGIGAPHEGRFLAMREGQLTLRIGTRDAVQSNHAIAPNAWQFVAASFDGTTARLYAGDTEMASATIDAASVAPVLHIAPNFPAPNTSVNAHHFAGEIADFQVDSRALSAQQLREVARATPNFALFNYENVAVGWPWQVKQQAGPLVPQEPATLPRSRAPLLAPHAKPLGTRVALQPIDDSTWLLRDWRLAEAPNVSATAARVAQPGFDASTWYDATVPGTVLTTLIDRGVYPDPDFGLNNMAIPETLARQDYWYRTEFASPAQTAGKRFTLIFKGINYAAEVWLNGARLGSIKGAFVRGVFDVTDALRSGARNALAVRISPPPHPGIPHEQSIAAGPGENGGAQALDGPTFIASEGWDWIPGIRDRNSGLWQDVILSASGEVTLGDAQVVTYLPLPDTSRAEIAIKVPLDNPTNAPISGTLNARFDDVSIAKSVTAQPGTTMISLTPAEFAQLNLTRPRLWWPNGYGKQELYDLELRFQTGSRISHRKHVRFGIRHLTYELSLFDEAGRLQRVEVDIAGGARRGERLIDVRHEALKKSPRGWAASLYPNAIESPAVKPLEDESLTPHLVLKVNGVRIASRGGNWGMDDSRKRISREKLEPYFRLHREANLNTIRNWVGQNTEEVFYELADEYGMLILNDFWASTQDFQVEPEDPQLFFANARDVIKRYRNHPSIALWFGRNEGVPHPILNSGLADLVFELDGTRHFSGSSNRVNLAGSGPYNYRAPVEYFTVHAQGYSVELGTPSLSTLESIRAWNAADDQWPLSDSLAYHDWHFGGNGDVASFMRTLEAQFGTATSLEDFERKAQLLNYTSYRAIFEGFHAHLWTKNSGRLLWMTHPAWPSHAWQIYSSDYDTHAAYYAVKKACATLHPQMNLPDYQLALVNTGPRTKVTLRAKVLSLDGKTLEERSESIDAQANAVSNTKRLDLAKHFASHPLVFVKLEALNDQGDLLADNFYWQGRDDAAYRTLNELRPAAIEVTATAPTRRGDASEIRMTLRNRSDQPAIATKLTLVRADGSRVLPAYYSDNYVSLLPNETRQIVIEAPAHLKERELRIGVRGWNVDEAVFAVGKAAQRAAADRR